MIASIAFLPHPPVLQPGMTGQPVAEVEALRTHCLAALQVVLRDAPDELVVVGSARPDEPEPTLSVRVAHALLGGVAHQLPVAEVVLPADASSELIAAAADKIGESPGRRALIVMGDGSARRTLKAPGYLDERAEPFDAAVAAALRAADPDALAAIQRGLADELLVAGWVPWQVAAVLARGRTWHCEVLETADPFGVFYAVAAWRAVEETA